MGFILLYAPFLERDCTLSLQGLLPITVFGLLEYLLLHAFNLFTRLSDRIFFCSTEMLFITL